MRGRCQAARPMPERAPRASSHPCPSSAPAWTWVAPGSAPIWLQPAWASFHRPSVPSCPESRSRLRQARAHSTGLQVQHPESLHNIPRPAPRSAAPTRAPFPELGLCSPRAASRTLPTVAGRSAGTAGASLSLPSGLCLSSQPQPQNRHARLPAQDMGTAPQALHSGCPYSAMTHSCLTLPTQVRGMQAAQSTLGVWHGQGNSL